MSTNSIFTILFEKPFWIGIYERFNDDKYEVAKIYFGTKEPTNNDIFNYLLNNYNSFIFSTPSHCDQKISKYQNPKRAQRDANKQLRDIGIGTKAQQELKAQFENNKKLRKTNSKLRKAEQEKAKYELRQEKKKNKHKGK